MKTSSDWIIDCTSIDYKKLVKVGRRSYTYDGVYNKIKIFITIPFNQSLNSLKREDLKNKCICVRLDISNLWLEFILNESNADIILQEAETY